MEKFEFAIQVMVIGFVVVLVTLFLLYGILLVFSLIFNRKEKPAKSDEIVLEAPLIKKPADNQSRLTAAVTAAIFCFLESQNQLNKIGEVTVLPQSTDRSVSNSWQIAGRKLMMQGYYDLENTRRNMYREKV
jgi:Na+-transporting methylmalonyl-CoA/oxaloacetate decarboxylase gamma subunit